MNSCCTAPAAKLNVLSATRPTRPRNWFLNSLQRLIDTAAFTAVDLTHVVFVDPDRPVGTAPRRTHTETR